MKSKLWRGWRFTFTGCWALVAMFGACAPSGPAKTPQAAPPPPYPPALAARVEQELPGCHAGDLKRCRALGHALLDGGYWREAAAAFAYACYLPSAVGHHEGCVQFRKGECAPNACDCAGQPDCPIESWKCTPEMRNHYCSAGSHERCIAAKQITECGVGARALYYWAIKRDNDSDTVCSDRTMQVTTHALELARYACEDLGQDDSLQRYWSEREGSGDSVCDGYEARTAQANECHDYRAFMARSEAEMAASRARFQRDLTQQLAAGIGDIAGTARQLQAAQRGEIAEHERVDVPVIGAGQLPTSTTDVRDALVARAPDLLLEIAKLHPKGKQLFESSKLALDILKAASAPPVPPAPSAQPETTPPSD